MSKNFLTILDLPMRVARDLVLRAKEIKDRAYQSDILKGKTIILIFEKASTRTRISFEVAIQHLGGKSVFMTPNESQLGRNEPLKDTARVLSRYAQGLVVRTFAQENLEELVMFGQVPVINALTDKFHPCQVMSDLLTIYERTPDFSQLKIAWVGDGNNMAHSWINAAVYFPFQLNMAVPKGYEPDIDVLERALQAGAKIYLTHDPKEAVAGVHYVNTDVWASMGQEDEHGQRKNAFNGFQVNSELLTLADPDVKVLHCLPAHRGEEITDEVIEGPWSVVWDQAENRLHMQKAILEWIYSQD
ncbi:ornithine carbamoyltransferase [Desulfohalobiaceae bacterium Ax17]|uniref:ornithine carbamoyltransferase n=1 Tax=Desulfovulcanus ferrireducens TaxID=2831190 RepID=UPI00207B9B98|nr:ornithine carbamoyltransferase [Desulfovulcanus ferrireducens]MBT8762937.1 ornithine carbamoyltransferase [Desulfovulcanus ferrireducens]